MRTQNVYLNLIRKHLGNAYYISFAVLFVLILLATAAPLSISHWEDIIFFAAAIFVLESELVELSANGIAVTMISGVLLAEATNLSLFPTLVSLVLSLPFLLWYYWSKNRFVVLFNISHYGVSTSLAYLAYRAAGGVLGDYYVHVLALLLYVLVYVVANYSFVVTAFIIREGLEPQNVLHYAFDFQTLVLFLVNMIIGILMGLAFQMYQALGVIALGAVLWLLAHSYQRYFTVAQEARSDPLTGLLNRQGFQMEVAKGIKHRECFSLLMIDLDHFKRINDSLGHLNGDKVLEAVAKLLLEQIGPKGVVSRYGGEEFCVLLSQDLAGAYQASEQVRERLFSWSLEELGFQLNTSPQISVSIGISTFPQHGGDLQTLLQHADEALYQAKVQRNTVVTYESTFPAAKTCSEEPVQTM